MQTEQMPKISIIVPVWKSVEYLDRVIPALLNQTWKNTEIILINDGSPDESAAICTRYAQEYPDKIIFIDAPHGGASSARNYGLDRATGEWIYFCDADDLPEPEICEYLLVQALETGAQLSGCACVCDKSKTIDIRTHFPGTGMEVWEREKIIKDGIFPFFQLDGTRPVNGYIHIALFQRKIIEENNIRFIKMRNLGDIAFFMEYLQYVDRFATSNKALYHYIFNPASLCATAFQKRTVPFFQMEQIWNRISNQRLKVFRNLDLGKTHPREERQLFLSYFYHNSQEQRSEPGRPRIARYRNFAGVMAEMRRDPLYPVIRLSELSNAHKAFLFSARLGNPFAYLFCKLMTLRDNFR